MLLIGDLGDRMHAYRYPEQNEIEEKCNCFSECVMTLQGGLLIFPSGLHKMDKSLPKLNLLSILYKPPDINPLYITIHSEWIRADLLSVILAASETTTEALHLVSEFNYNII